MKEEEVKSLQSQIQQLNELCSDALTPADQHASRTERLGILLLRLQDGDLAKRYFLRLEKWLLADSQALEFYVEFMNLSAMLHFHFHPEPRLSILSGSHSQP